MKRISISIILLLFFISNYAQNSADTTYWVKGGDFALNFTQVSLSNWSAGGQNSVSGVTGLNLFANYKKTNTAWENKLSLGYGLSKQEGLETQKSEDIIDLQSKLGIKASKKWFYSALFSFTTQFAPGYSDVQNTTKISNGFAPAYMNLSLGMDYKPNDKFAMQISPLSGKMTIVTDEDLDGMFGVQSGETTRLEMGANLNAAFKTSVVKNVNLVTDLSLFSNYLDQPENIDVDWKIAIDMKINDFLSARINTRLIYDDDIKTPVEGIEGKMAPQVQFKEVLGFGLNVKF